MTRLSIFLLLAALVSALLLVHSQYETRRLFMALESAKKEAKRLEVDHDRLLVERRAHRLNGAAGHGAGAVDHRDEGLPRPVGDGLGHRGGEGDQAGHLVLGLQGDDVDIELSGELHGDPPSARAPAQTSPLSQGGLTPRGRQSLWECSLQTLVGSTR